MSFKGLEPISYGGKEVWPLVEGGKGVSATNHASSGAWAAAGGIGTVSAVNADSYDADGNPIPQVYPQATRNERFEQLVRYAIDGALMRSAEARRLDDMAGDLQAVYGRPATLVAGDDVCLTATVEILRYWLRIILSQRLEPK